MLVNGYRGAKWNIPNDNYLAIWYVGDYKSLLFFIYCTKMKNYSFSILTCAVLFVPNHACFIHCICHSSRDTRWISQALVDNMADITNLFKATIKTVKSRNKELNKDRSTNDKSHIFPSTKHRGEFETTSKEVV